MVVSTSKANTVKALLIPQGACLISGLKRERGGGGAYWRGGLNRDGGGAYFKSFNKFDEIHTNFPNFTMTPISKTEQEIGHVSPF